MEPSITIKVGQVWISAVGNVFAITKELDNDRFSADRLGYFADNGNGPFRPLADESPTIHRATLELPTWRKIGNSRKSFEQWAAKHINDNIEEGIY
jgi:hypothetical protein